jgi:hypothetical protein
MLLPHLGYFLFCCYTILLLLLVHHAFFYSFAGLDIFPMLLLLLQSFHVSAVPSAYPRPLLYLESCLYCCWTIW